MPANPPPWPAFAGAPSAGAPLTVYRAVLGKVHQAASDFRWITHPEAIRPRKLGLDALLSFGSEDRPVRTPAWRSLPEAAVAIVGSPSRAVDRAGRAGGLEKQILYWPTPDPRQFVTGAFALLAAIQEASDAVWWEHWEDFRWDEPGFFLPRDPEPIALGRTDLLVAEGLTQLTAACSQEQVSRLYAEMLAAPSTRPAAVEGLAEALPALAIAALLLPFSARQAATLSIVGALPNSRHMPAALENWNAVFRTTEQPGIPGAGLRPSAAEIDRGAAMAAAIWRGEPEVRALLKQAPPPKPAPPPPKPVAPPVVVQPPVAAEPPTLSPIAQRFERFLAAGPAQRSLDAIPGNAEILAADAGRFLMGRAIQAISHLQPAVEGDSPRARQLQIKLELVRAWVTSCYPAPEAERELSALKNHRIPPLLFAIDLSPEGWARASTLSADELRRLVAASRRLKNGFTREQWSRFEQWSRHPSLGLAGGR